MSPLQKTLRSLPIFFCVRHKHKNEDEEVIELLDQMVSILYQKSIIRKTVLGKIHYAETHYLEQSVAVTEEA